MHEISNNVVCAISRASDQPAHTRSLIKAFAYSLVYPMSVKLLTEHHLRFLSLKGGCKGLSLHLSKCQIVGNLMPRLNSDIRIVRNNLFVYTFLRFTMIYFTPCSQYFLNIHCFYIPTYNRFPLL